MRESVKIVEQALDGLPEGPYITTNRKVALPPRHELATSMEALIHHFKLVTEGFRVPAGRGLRGDRVAARRAGLLHPRRRLGQARARAHARPELRQPPGAARHGRGRADRRHDRHRRHARPDPRWDRPVSATARREAAARAGTRPPISSDDPAVVPDPAEVRGAGRACASGDRGADGALPGPPLGRAAGARTRRSACTAGARREAIAPGRRA